MSAGPGTLVVGPGTHLPGVARLFYFFTPAVTRFARAFSTIALVCFMMVGT
jgi:hypothetical protein